MHERSDCVSDFAAIIPIIEALGGESAVRSLGRSIVSVGVWWPWSTSGTFQEDCPPRKVLTFILTGTPSITKG